MIIDANQQAERRQFKATLDWNAAGASMNAFNIYMARGVTCQTLLSMTWSAAAPKLRVHKTTV
jgi:hypothetical protein